MIVWLFGYIIVYVSKSGEIFEFYELLKFKKIELPSGP